MREMITRTYDILLDASSDDRDYTQGNYVGGYRVYGDAKEMSTEFMNLFDKERINTNVRGLYFKSQFNNTTITFTCSRDTDIPGKPLCFGTLDVSGEKPDVKSVDSLLTSTFPEFDKLVKEYSLDLSPRPKY